MPGVGTTQRIRQTGEPVGDWRGCDGWCLGAEHGRWSPDGGATGLLNVCRNAKRLHRGVVSGKKR